MVPEEFLIVGILDESQARGEIKPEELKSLMCEHLQLDSFYHILMEVLIERGLTFTEKLKIDIQFIFKALETTQFIKSTPSYFNRRLSKYTIKMLRAALVIYTRGMKQIGDGASVHQMKEFENFSTGIPYNAEVIRSMLWVIGLTISSGILDKWIEMHADCVETKKTLMIHEFLYLLCNTKDRGEMYERIPKLTMNPRMNPKNQLFHVDRDFHKTYKSPDYKMQHMLNLNYNVDKATYEGISKSRLNIKQKNTQVKGKQVAVTERNGNNEEDNFRKQLRSLLVTVEIKKRLKETNQKVTRLRLNGQNAYDILVEDGATNLTSPLNGKQTEQDLKASMKSKRGPTTRPTTAHSPNTEVSNLRLTKLRPQSPLQFYLTKSRFAKSPNSNRPLTTASTVNTENGRSSSKLMSTQRNFYTSASDYFETHTSSRFKNSRRHHDTSYMTTENKSDILSSFDQIIDQEYSIFEHNDNKSKQPSSAKQASLYYNGRNLKQHSTKLSASKTASALVRFRE